MGEDAHADIVENRTPWRLVIDIPRSGDPPLVLGPQMEVPLSDAWKAADLAPWRRQGFVVVQPPRTDASPVESAPARGGSLVPVLARIVGYALFFLLVLTALDKLPYLSGSPVVESPLGAFLLAAATTFLLAAFVDGRTSGEHWTRLRRTLILQNASLVAVIAIAILGALLPLETLPGGGFLLPDPDVQDRSNLRRLTATLLFVFLVTASLLPSLLYYLFDRQQIGTLRRRFFSDAIRLDPGVWTLDEAERKYGRRVDEFIGSDLRSGTRLIAGNRSPIIFCTVLITLGWILTLTPGFQGVTALAGQAGPEPAVSEILLRLTPPPVYLVYGFLGAYTFAVLMLLSSYVMGDMRPKAYSDVAVRIIVAMIFGWLIEPGLYLAQSLTRSAAAAEGSASVGQLLAFLFGVFPRSGLAWLAEVARSLKSVRIPGTGMRFPLFPGAVERHPLNHLEGINLYDRARLIQEGVANVGHLAHGNLVDLMLQTRIPARRLVDLVDQAILYVHLSETIDTADAYRRGDVEHLSPPLLKLRGYGIRTASDLERAFTASRCRDAAAAGGRRDHEKAFLEILDTPRSGLPRLQVVLDALRDDEWMREIRYWRLTSQQTRTLDRSDLDRIAQGEPPTPDLRPPIVYQPWLPGALGPGNGSGAESGAEGRG